MENMDINAIIDGIVKRQEDVGLTYQQIADASGVSRSTVMRILKKQTPEPSLKNIADIAMAVGYDIDPVQPAVLKDHTKDSYITYLQEAVTVEKKLAQRERDVQEHRHNRIVAEKNRTILFLVLALILVISLLICWLIIDVLHPSLGWIQRTAAWRSNTARHFMSALHNIRCWLNLV